MKRFATTLVAAAAVLSASVALADMTPQSLPFFQNWSSAAMITLNDDWSGVPGIVGFIGDSDPVGAVSNVDPQTLTADLPAVAVDVIAQALTTSISGGVGEFDGLADPVVGLQGSGTADAPYLLLNVVASGLQSITLSYDLRDIDGTLDNSTQQSNAQFRIGTSGAWTNIVGTYVADASTGPSLATLVTPISVVLPNTADGQPVVQIRIMTTNAAGSDEWVGVDNISVTGSQVPVPTRTSTWGAVKQLYR